MTKEAKNILALLALIIIVLILVVLWYFNIFNFTSMDNTPAEQNNPAAVEKPLTREERKDRLDSLLPENPLTEAEVQEKLDRLDQLAESAPTPAPAETVTPSSADTAAADAAMEERIKRLESLQN